MSYTWVLFREKKQQLHDAYLQFTVCHFFDATTSPSLCAKQVNSSDVIDETGRNSLFMRMLLSVIKLLCQLLWPLTDQVKLKYFSHSLAQVSTQVKVTLSPPDQPSEITVKTNIRGNVLTAVMQSKCSTIHALFWHLVSFNTHHRGCAA